MCGSNTNATTTTNDNHNDNNDDNDDTGTTTPTTTNTTTTTTTTTTNNVQAFVPVCVCEVSVCRQLNPMRGTGWSANPTRTVTNKWLIIY